MLQCCWAEARIKIARMTLTIKLDRNWSSFQLANSAPPLSVTDSAIAPSARMHNCAGVTNTTPHVMNIVLVGTHRFRKNWRSHIDASHSRQPLVKGERLVRYQVNAVMQLWCKSTTANRAVAIIVLVVGCRHDVTPKGMLLLA